MPAPITTSLVWRELGKQLFAVLSYVTPKGEARSAGVVYVVHDGQIYIRTDAASWKAKHIRENPHVALNVTIPKRVPLMPWIHIPQATIAFSGTARVLEPGHVAPEVLKALGVATSHDPEAGVTLCILEVTPRGNFATYGIGVPVLEMRDPAKARGRVAVAA